MREMFREIRRKQKELHWEAIQELLLNERYGTLAVNGDGGYPYALPVNFLYSEGKIYFHGSGEGHKADSIRRDSQVCFTLCGPETIAEETWAPYVRSVIVFGQCKLIADRAEALRLCKRFAQKYYPDEALIGEEMAKSGKAVQMYEIVPEHISGKLIQEK